MDDDLPDIESAGLKEEENEPVGCEEIEVISDPSTEYFDENIVSAGSSCQRARLNSTVMDKKDEIKGSIRLPCPNISRISGGFGKFPPALSPVIFKVPIAKSVEESTTEQRIGKRKSLEKLINDDSLAKIQEELANDWDFEAEIVAVKVPDTIKSKKAGCALQHQRINDLKETSVQTPVREGTSSNVNRSNLSTPNSSFVVTPRPDYDSMPTPEIKVSSFHLINQTTASSCCILWRLQLYALNFHPNIVS